jgi:hypothetical protein
VNADEVYQICAGNIVDLYGLPQALDSARR